MEPIGRVTAEDNARLAGTFEHAGDTAQRVMDRVAETRQSMAAAGSRLLNAEQRWVAAGSDYIREHPIAATSIAVATGFLLSRLMSSSGGERHSRHDYP